MPGTFHSAHLSNALISQAIVSADLATATCFSDANASKRDVASQLLRSLVDDSEATFKVMTDSDHLFDPATIVTSARRVADALLHIAAYTRPENN